VPLDDAAPSERPVVHALNRRVATMQDGIDAPPRGRFPMPGAGTPLLPLREEASDDADVARSRTVTPVSAHPAASPGIASENDAHEEGAIAPLDLEAGAVQPLDVDADAVESLDEEAGAVEPHDEEEGAVEPHDEEAGAVQPLDVSPHDEAPTSSASAP